MTSKLLLSFGCALAFATAAVAQDEMNDAGGSLRHNNINMTPGNPFVIFEDGGVDLDVGGAPSSPYILALGTYQTPGSAIPALGGQLLGLNLAAPVVVIGDAIGGTGALPAGLFVLNALGRGNFQFGASPALIGATLGFQAVVLDAGAPAFLNLSAPVAYTFAAGIPINLLTPLSGGSGDDGWNNYTFAGGPYVFYGQAYTGMSIGTNGWITFGNNATTSTLGETTPLFLGGGAGTGTTTAPRPTIAVLWDDLDVGNNATQALTLLEDVANATVTVSWVNADFFVSTFIGTITATINFSGPPSVTFDYTGMATAPAVRSLIGISDGNLAQSLALPAGPDTEADMAFGAAVIPFGPSGMDYVSYFQNFNAGSPFSEAFDYQGLVFNWIDVSGLGDWFVF